MIMNELDQKGRGYKDENFALKSLFFADDALLLSHSLEEARENLEPGYFKGVKKVSDGVRVF